MNDAVLNIIIRAKEQASKAIDRTKDSLTQIGNNAQAGFGKVVEWGKYAALAFVAAGGAAATFAVRSAANFEQTRIGLENMLGSADRARGVLKTVSDFAASTPFEFPELAQSVRQLVAFGFSADDAVATMKSLGDVSAAVGAPINDLSYLMGTLRTQGRAFTVDIRQFAQRGIPIYEYLAKVLNTNEQAISAMIEEGKIGFPEVQKAFQMMTGEGGKFHNTMAKQSKSLSGLFSTMKDTLAAAGREMIGINSEGDIMAGSIMDRLKNGLSGFTQLAEEGLPRVKALFEGIITTVEKTVGFLERNRIVAAALAGMIAGPLVVAFGAWAIAAGTAAIATIAATWPILAIGAAIGALAYLVVTNWDTIKAAFFTAVEWIGARLTYLKDNFWSIIGQIIGFVATLPIKLPILAAQAIAAMVQALISVRWSDVFSGIWNAAKAVFDRVQNAFVGIWQYLHGLKWSDIFSGVAKGIGNALLGMLEGAVKGALKGLPGNLESKFKLPRFEHGVRNFGGGLAVVGDVQGRGGELIDLPKGSNVYSNRESKAMLAGMKGDTIINITNNNEFKRDSDPLAFARQQAFELSRA